MSPVAGMRAVSHPSATLLGTPSCAFREPSDSDPIFFPFHPIPCPLLGYSVSSMLLRGGRRLFLSGAPRFRHRGKVIAFQLKRDGAVRVAQSLHGEQVRCPREGGTPWGTEGPSGCGGGKGGIMRGA